MKKLVRVLKDPFIVLTAVVLIALGIWTWHGGPGLHVIIVDSCFIHEDCVYKEAYNVED